MRARYSKGLRGRMTGIGLLAGALLLPIGSARAQTPATKGAKGAGRVTQDDEEDRDNHSEASPSTQDVDQIEAAIGKNHPLSARGEFVADRRKLGRRFHFSQRHCGLKN